MHQRWGVRESSGTLPGCCPSVLFLIFVTRGRNELNSPRRTLSGYLRRSIGNRRLVRERKGGYFSREQRTSHTAGWRAGAIIVLACNVRSVGGQDPVGFFLVSERASASWKLVCAVWCQWHCSAAAAAHISQALAQHVRAAGTCVLGRATIIREPASGPDNLVWVPIPVFPCRYLFVRMLRVWGSPHGEYIASQRILPPIVISLHLVKCARSFAVRGQKSNISIPPVWWSG